MLVAVSHPATPAVGGDASAVEVKVGDRVQVVDQRSEYHGLQGEIIEITKAGALIVQLEVKLPNWKAAFEPQEVELQVGVKP